MLRIQSRRSLIVSWDVQRLKVYQGVKIMIPPSLCKGCLIVS